MAIMFFFLLTAEKSGNILQLINIKKKFSSFFPLFLVMNKRDLIYFIKKNWLESLDSNKEKEIMLMLYLMLTKSVVFEQACVI